MNGSGPGMQRYLLVALLIALALLCLQVLEPFVAPIVWAAILAYASWPAYGALRRLLQRWNSLAAFLMTLTLACAVVVPVLWILALVQSELVRVYQPFAQFVAQGPHPLPAFIRDLPWIGARAQEMLDRYTANPGALAQAASTAFLRWSSDLGGIVGGVGRNLVRLTLTLLTLFFLYRDGDSVARQSRAVMQRFFADRLDAYVATAAAMTRAVVYGMLVTAVVQGVLGGIGYRVVGLPAPVLFGALTAIASVVPLVGTAIVWVPASIWLLSSGQVVHGLILFGWGAVLVHPADNVLRPILISNATRVPFLLVMFGALGGLQSFGLLGIFVGPVLLAVAMAIWREWASRAPGEATDRPA